MKTVRSENPICRESGGGGNRTRVRTLAVAKRPEAAISRTAHQPTCESGESTLERELSERRYFAPEQRVESQPTMDTARTRGNWEIASRVVRPTSRPPTVFAPTLGAASTVADSGELLG